MLSPSLRTIVVVPEANALSFESRLVAEAVRLHEEARGAPLSEPEADRVAQAVETDLESRLIVRANALSIAPVIRDTLAQVRAVSALAIAAAAIVAAAAGVTTAHLVLAAPSTTPTNFFAILAGLLGAPTFMLIVWTAVILISPGGAAALGSAVMALGRALSRRLDRGPLAIAAVHATGAVFADSALGRWALSAISHGLWLAYLTGCIADVLFLLGTREFTFAWATTILTEQHYVLLTRAIAVIPEALGFLAPDAAQIADSRWRGDGAIAANARTAWAGLLIGCLVVYGALPRIALLALCAIQWRRTRRRFRLDASLPGYARLQPRLQPIARPVGIVDADAAGVAGPAPSMAAPAIREDGLTALLGLEIARPPNGWPPNVPTVTWLDLGFVDDRDDRRRSVDTLRSLAEPPRAVVVVCSLATTPDRGTRAFLHELQHETGVPVLLLLTDGQSLRDRARAGDVLVRIDDWRSLAVAAGIPGERVIEVDLAHVTAPSRRRLHAWLGGGLTNAKAQTAAPPAIDAAFTEIIAHARRWAGPPSVEQRAALHRTISALYADGGQQWRALLRLNGDIGRVGIDQIKASAQRMVDLLPASLRVRPRWLAAGAAAGALACVVAASVIAPAAIAALPAWMGLGAAAALAWPSARRDEPGGAEATDDLSEAVAAAALLALVLHLQGRDETTITRLLDAVLGHDDPPPMADAEAAAAWLAGVGDRLRDVLAAEAG